MQKREHDTGNYPTKLRQKLEVNKNFDILLRFMKQNTIGILLQITNTYNKVRKTIDSY